MLCILCGIRESIYEKVRHCKLCHSIYNHNNYLMHGGMEMLNVCKLHKDAVVVYDGILRCVICAEMKRLHTEILARDEETAEVRASCGILNKKVEDLLELNRQKLDDRIAT